MERTVINHGEALRNAKEGKAVQKRKQAGRDQATWRILITAGVVVSAVLLIGAMAAPLDAQTYPSKPIRLILPFPPGGTTDTLGRIIATKLTDRLGQTIVCENRPGAGANIGLEIGARATPDGYTIILASPSLGISPALYKKLNYDPVKDFAPITLVAEIPNVLLVRPNLPFKTLKELVKYARDNPRKLNFGSGGVGTSNHLASELLKSLAKVDIVHVPYKGSFQALVGLMGGEVDMVVMAPASALPHIEAGKARALAMLSEQRLPALPNVPTAGEAGIDDYVVSTWYGLLAPAGTPRNIVNRLNAEWVKIESMPDTREKLQNAGFEPICCTSDKFSEFIKADIVRWAKVVREGNLRVD
jgi:tripartite-type tricarboxylate transporter receptor subunit TctC